LTAKKNKPKKNKPARYKRKSSANAILAAKKQAKALTLRLKGYTLKEIAKQLGYANKSVAYNTIMSGIDKVRAEHADEYRAIECARMDSYLKTIRGKILKGDVKAIDCAVRISARRARLLGLDPKEPMIQVNEINNTEVNNVEVNFEDEDFYLLLPNLSAEDLERQMKKIWALMPENIREKLQNVGVEVPDQIGSEN